MGILTDGDGLIDAALSELQLLPLDLRHRRDRVTHDATFRIF